MPLRAPGPLSDRSPHGHPPERFLKRNPKDPRGSFGCLFLGDPGSPCGFPAKPQKGIRTRIIDVYVCGCPVKPPQQKRATNSKNKHDPRLLAQGVPLAPRQDVSTMSPMQVVVVQPDRPGSDRGPCEPPTRKIQVPGS